MVGGLVVARVLRYFVGQALAAVSSAPRSSSMASERQMRLHGGLEAQGLRVAAVSVPRSSSMAWE
jgi:hypothetical protein